MSREVNNNSVKLSQGDLMLCKDCENFRFPNLNKNKYKITNICKAHIVSIRAESEAPAVARWRVVSG